MIPGRAEHERPKAPTINDVAAAAGVSKSAVSRALLGQGDVSISTRKRVAAAAQQLGYVANAMARGLVSSRTGTLGIVVRDITRPYYGALYAAVQRRAEERGHRVIMTSSTGELAFTDALSALRDLVSFQVDGLILASAAIEAEQITPFIDRVPVVAAGRLESNPAITSVYCDDVDGGSRLAEHLLGLGHRHVAVALVSRSYSLSQHGRGAAMVQRLREAGAQVLVREIENDGAMAAAIEAVVTDRNVTALMCPTDVAQMDALEGLLRAGLRAPDDLSLTGYDGLPPLSSPYLGLTTYTQPVDEIGREAVDLLLARIEDPRRPGRHLAIRGQVVPGRTTGPIPRQAGGNGAHRPSRP